MLQFHSVLFARNHCSTSKCPPSAANVHVHPSHGQPFARNHLSISRSPSDAAAALVSPSHGQPCARNHRSTSKCPPTAAAAHVLSSHGQPISRNSFNFSSFPLLAAAWHRYARGSIPLRSRRSTALTHPLFAALSPISSLNRSPVPATALRIARLTDGSRARSAGSSKYSVLRMWVTTKWSGRPGIASCGSIWCAVALGFLYVQRALWSAQSPLLAAVAHQLARALLTVGPLCRSDRTALRAVSSLEEHLVQRTLRV